MSRKKNQDAAATTPPQSSAPAPAVAAPTVEDPPQVDLHVTEAHADGATTQPPVPDGCPHPDKPPADAIGVIERCASCDGVLRVSRTATVVVTAPGFDPSSVVEDVFATADKSSDDAAARAQAALDDEQRASVDLSSDGPTPEELQEERERMRARMIRELGVEVKFIHQGKVIDVLECALLRIEEPEHGWEYLPTVLECALLRIEEPEHGWEYLPTGDGMCLASPRRNDAFASQLCLVKEPLGGYGHTLDGQQKASWMPGEVGRFAPHVVDSAPSCFEVAVTEIPRIHDPED